MLYLELELLVFTNKRASHKGQSPQNSKLGNQTNVNPSCCGGMRGPCGKERRVPNKNLQHAGQARTTIVKDCKKGRHTSVQDCTSNNFMVTKANMIDQILSSNTICHKLGRQPTFCLDFRLQGVVGIIGMTGASATPQGRQ